MFFNNLNNLNNKISNAQSDGEYYGRLKPNQNVVIENLEKRA